MGILLRLKEEVEIKPCFTVNTFCNETKEPELPLTPSEWYQLKDSLSPLLSQGSYVQVPIGGANGFGSHLRMTVVSELRQVAFWSNYSLSIESRRTLPGVRIVAQCYQA